MEEDDPYPTFYAPFAPSRRLEWSPTTLKEKLIDVGAKVVSHGRYVVFLMAEAAIPRDLFADISRMTAELPPSPLASTLSVRTPSIPAKPRERRVSITSNSSISLVATAASAGHPPSWAPATRSTTAPPCQKHQIEESLHLNRSRSGEFRLIYHKGIIIYIDG